MVISPVRNSSPDTLNTFAILGPTPSLARRSAQQVQVGSRPGIYLLHAGGGLFGG